MLCCRAVAIEIITWGTNSRSGTEEAQQRDGKFHKMALGWVSAAGAPSASASYQLGTVDRFYPPRQMHFGGSSIHLTGCYGTGCSCAIFVPFDLMHSMCFHANPVVAFYASRGSLFNVPGSFVELDVLACCAC